MLRFTTYVLRVVCLREAKGEGKYLAVSCLKFMCCMKN